jgi:hypothetical protein
MTKKLSETEKVNTLENSMKSFKFPKKYFIYRVNAGANIKFCIASKNEVGGIHTHSGFKTYDEMNQYLMGWNAAKTKKY